MLACCERLHRPFVVQAVRKRVVYRVDIGVVQKIIITVVDLGDRVLLGEFGGSGWVAGCDSVDDNLGMASCW